MAKKNTSVQAPKSCRGLRAVQEFSCIGGECENTCCKIWAVSLTKRDYVVWRSLAKKKPEELKLFQEHVPKEKSERSNVYARLAFDKETKVCPFHDKSGMCRVHSKLGAEALPGTCRNFPKMHYIDRGGIQVSGTLACPEYARKVLASDRATDIIEVASPLADTTIHQLKSTGMDWHWQRCLPEIGELAVSMLKKHQPSY